MANPDRLSDCCVAILGLGLMGGSLALALREKCTMLLGIDRDPHTLEKALQSGAIDQAVCYPDELLPQADLIVLAIPVLDIIHTIHKLPTFHSGSPVVLDLGSTKHQILAAMEALPERFHPIGGHPMCGKESGGFANASKDLYQSAPFALVPAERTSPRARSIALEVALAVGARPLWLDAATHDDWTAATSHFPYLLASALASVTPKEARPLVGPGLRSTTRVAATSPEIMLDILETNSGHVLEAFESFHSQLDRLETLIRQGNWGELRTILEQAAEKQQYLAGGAE